MKLEIDCLVVVKINIVKMMQIKLQATFHPAAFDFIEVGSLVSPGVTLTVHVL